MGRLQGCFFQVMLVCLTAVGVAFSEQARLPPPENVSMSSMNLIHILHWNPVPEHWGNVNYSVQIQRVSEQKFQDGAWMEVEHCQSVSEYYCNVTDDVINNTLFAFRVRSEQEDSVSDWEEMQTLFNRVTSLLIPPNISLEIIGLDLKINIQDYGDSFIFFAYFWQKGKEDEVKSVTINRVITSTLFDKTEEGFEYCAYVIAYAIPINRNSSKSDTVCVKASAWLPHPKNISISSINLIHILCWSPVSESWGKVNYTVEIQGEYERRYKRGDHWTQIEHCQSISQHCCNVTNDVAGNVLYAFRVQSEQGDRVSNWANMETMFTRETSILIPPNISLEIIGLHLKINIQHYGESFQFFVNFWQKGREMEETGILMSRGSPSTLLDKMEEGNEYCAYVIAYAIPIYRNSSKSDTVCIKAPTLPPLALIISLLFAFLVVLVPLAYGVWRMSRVMRYCCCPQEDLPDVLKNPYPSQQMVNQYYTDDESMTSVELDVLMSSQEISTDQEEISR
ncbi:interleukin-20 receptor subunit beta isoform X2 [Hyperolius riggenbachi]|uniref:interleukin-20 receptor subunit beta isoform X2 n=1 Tax=Hyperolius riggenbachi TaxID=752182 RepID=UPI0035A3BFAB